MDPRDPRVILMLSYYRDAELRGATLLLKIALRLEDPEAQLNLARHLTDEARHTWLLTQRIAGLGATPVKVEDGYQSRMRILGGVPRTILDLYAVTLVAEERARQRYVDHAGWPEVDRETRDLLRTFLKDEEWHIAWVVERLKELAAVEGPERVAAALQRYRKADEMVVRTLREKEREAFGFSLGDLSPERV